ncbi:amidohydrolase [Subtercola boreus]|uniref:Amidohydrolase n=1 Tax=Subtercola boreus TaxID=120213 RepID=A0A3E0VIL5_9MICO|nr:amidohydrolase family protein [Subtercola boreus]RFA09804.1 amidohydrolase [Subtercola boreus]TQL53078.1 imidazolonepropionase-like amidohydrolase [Subtercola boreus]
MSRATGTLTVTDALVFDGVSDDLVEADITVVDGVIAEVGPGLTRVGRVVDAKGRAIVPGFIDAHFHAYSTAMGGMELELRPLSYVSIVGTHRLAAALRRGFTTVRDVAGGDIGLARAIDEDLFPSPRYHFTGPALSQTGGHGDPRPGDLDLCFHGGHMNEIVDGVDDLRRAVRQRFRTGAHAIKVMTSGGVVSLTDPIRVPQYSAEELLAVSDEATRRGSYVAAHAYSPEAIIHSVTNGIRSIEHGNLLDEEAAALMAAHGAFLVPTLVAYDAMNRRGDEVNLNPISRAKNSEVLDAGKTAVQLARAAGVQIGFGSDLMSALADDQLQGIRLQLEVESVADVLRSLTSVNASLLQRTDIGRIAPGAAGDLLLLDGNPFDDSALLWDQSRPRQVVQSGLLV